MERADLDTILERLEKTDEDVKSIGETWAIAQVVIDNVPEHVRGRFKFYDIELKDGRTFFMRMRATTKVFEDIPGIGDDLMT